MTNTTTAAAPTSCNLVAADGAPKGYADRVADGTYRVHFGTARDGLPSGWHFFTPADLAARGWRAV